VLEFRNFCVRKVEIVLVNNFKDNSKDEYVVRIDAHAQRIQRTNNATISEDAYVTNWTEYWTFGRLDNAWKLKEIVLRKKVKSLSIKKTSMKIQTSNSFSGTTQRRERYR